MKLWKKLMNWCAKRSELYAGLLVHSSVEARLWQISQLRDWRRPAEELSAEDRAAALDVPQDNALWQTVHAELDDAIMAAVDSATGPNCQDREYQAGGVESLRDFQRRLIEARRKARVERKEKR